jgi:hypothetical protein
MAYDCEFFFCETLATFVASYKQQQLAIFHRLPYPPKAVMFAERVLFYPNQLSGRVDDGNKASSQDHGQAQSLG